ncbi:MAG: excinuclease ABC subunit UvrC [Coriobacteriia bacterium]|nr:excinuclease ABC subunit UvrC [Coriobacteriia bacterium]
MPTLREQLSHVPDKPGVYLWKDAEGKVLYVGKAKALRKRMRQYVSGHDDRIRIPYLMQEVASFDYVVTRNESESLILEINLIQELNPPYNVDFKDDKSYPFIALTLGDSYPGIKFTREKRMAGTRYFGPYTDSRAAREVIDTVRRLIPICRCTCPEWRQVARIAKAGRSFQSTARPCFDSHIGLGPGVCQGAIEEEEYRRRIDQVIEFLNGRYAPIERELQAAMDEAAAELDFEAAARYRNRLEAVEALKSKQSVVAQPSLDADIIGLYREETVAGAFVLVVRGGRVLYTNEYILDKGVDVDFETLMQGFLTRYYLQAADIPPAVVIEAPLADRSIFEDWLTVKRREGDSRAAQVHIEVPQRAVKRELIEMAQRNAKHALMRWMVRTHYEDDRLNTALTQLTSALALTEPPYRIECYDISTLHGAHSVGSMVVFTAGKKDPNAYRRFKIRRAGDEANDVAMMREVLSRRFAPRNAEDGRFAKKPDLIIVDGGKPQLNAARAVLEELGVAVSVVGLAKREEEIFVTWQDAPVVLPDGAPSLYLMKRIRDEAHRFAVEYHRMLRSKAMTASILEEVEGIGPAKRKAIVKHFGSFAKLRAASAAEIAAVPGVNETTARNIHAVLRV